MSASEFNIRRKIFVAIVSMLVSLGGARGFPVLAVVGARAVGLEASNVCGPHVRAADEGDISWLIKPGGLQDL